MFQDPKVREVLGFGKGNNVEGKLVTIVHGNDLVNISFLNFQAMQEDTAKVKLTSTFPRCILPLCPVCFLCRMLMIHFMMLS